MIPFLDFIVEVTFRGHSSFQRMMLKSPDKGFQAAIIKKVSKSSSYEFFQNEWNKKKKRTSEQRNRTYKKKKQVKIMELKSRITENSLDGVKSE